MPQPDRSQGPKAEAIGRDLPTPGPGRRSRATTQTDWAQQPPGRARFGLPFTDGPCSRNVRRSWGRCKFNFLLEFSNSRVRVRVRGCRSCNREPKLHCRFQSTISGFKWLGLRVGLLVALARRRPAPAVKHNGKNNCVLRNQSCGI